MGRTTLWLVGLVGLAGSAACAPAADDVMPPRDVPRDDAADVVDSRCGPGGECEDAYLSCCPSGCVDLTSDLFNCGECDYECELNEECQASRCFTPECFPECAARQICCDGDCVDPSTDNLNCGRCGYACEDPLRCLGGVCLCGTGATARMCGPTETCCPAGCVDTSTDRNNCGACGNVCNLECVAGQCRCGETVCPPGWACCDPDRSECFDTRNDMDHCGNCDTKCEARRADSCTDGQCMCGPTLQCSAGTPYPLCTVSMGMAPERCCRGECEVIDDGHCEACGRACTFGLDCQGSAHWTGVCTFSCEVPE